jgi:hypothetical protein
MKTLIARVTTPLLLALGLVAASAASAETLDKMNENYARYEAFAGEPVEEIRNFRLDRWQPVGRYGLVLWTRVTEAYLIDVDRGCYGLDFAKAIATTSTVNTLHRKFDKIVFGHERCRIDRIRPIDYKAYRAARKAEREAEKRG